MEGHGELSKALEWYDQLLEKDETNAVSLRGATEPSRACVAPTEKEPSRRGVFHSMCPFSDDRKTQDCGDQELAALAPARRAGESDRSAGAPSGCVLYRPGRMAGAGVAVRGAAHVRNRSRARARLGRMTDWLIMSQLFLWKVPPSGVCAGGAIASGTSEQFPRVATCGSALLCWRACAGVQELSAHAGDVRCGERGRQSGGGRYA